METGEHAFIETMKFVNRKTRSLMFPDFGEYSGMYTSTTENVSGYMDSLQVQGKDVLTVTASGDHLINLYLGGAHQVDCYDSNRNTYFMTMLKLGALQALSYEEFITFFTLCEKTGVAYAGMLAYQERVGHNEHFFDYQFYQKIRPYLTQNVAEYWDLLYKEFNYNGASMEKDGRDLLMASSLEDMVASNLYLKSPELYYQARQACAYIQPKFYVCDVFELHTIPNMYDVISLSNIYDYATHELKGTVSSDEFVDYAENTLSNNLNPDGKIAITYQYHYRLKKNYFNTTGLKRLFESKYEFERRPELEKYKLKKIMVPSVVEDYRVKGGQDCLYVYEKGRTK